MKTLIGVMRVYLLYSVCMCFLRDEKKSQVSKIPTPAMASPSPIAPAHDTCVKQQALLHAAMYIYIYIYISIYQACSCLLSFPWGVARSVLGGLGAPMGPLGSPGPRPNELPWALLGQAQLRHPWALMGRALVALGPCGPGP